MSVLPERVEFDSAVVGGGIFGCWLALCLAREFDQKVVLCEREPALLQRASYRNQARVHNGYHYPRSVLTGLRSRANSSRFLREFAECIDGQFAQYYAVGRVGSNVTAAQFERFCERIGAPLAPAEQEVQELFDRDRVEKVWRVEEWAFDAAALGQRMRADLVRAGVTLLFEHEAERVERAGQRGLRLDLRARDGAAPRSFEVQHVFNATYSSLNGLLLRSGLSKIALKQEVTELALVEMPPLLRRVGVTVMCGPFFSFMPFPARGLHTFSHVRYTPHHSWHDRQVDFDNQAYFEALRESSRFLHMQRDAARYMPLVARCVQRDTLIELKTVLPQSEHDDSRPILFYRHVELPGLVSVLGGKVDNIYDIERELAGLFAGGVAA